MKGCVLLSHIDAVGSDHASSGKGTWLDQYIRLLQGHWNRVMGPDPFFCSGRTVGRSCYGGLF
jgi:hypothetical protein